VSCCRREGTEDAAREWLHAGVGGNGARDPEIVGEEAGVGGVEGRQWKLRGGGMDGSWKTEPYLGRALPAPTN
jgi:hypothetical protein